LIPDSGILTMTSPHTPPSTIATTTPKIYILIPNPRKSNNLGPILRCAAAYSITQIILVGYAHCSTDGSHGAAKHLDIVAFPTLKQAVGYLREVIVGLLGEVGVDAADGDGRCTTDDGDDDFIEGEEEVMEDEEKKVVKIIIGRKRDERRKRRRNKRLLPDENTHDSTTVDTRSTADNRSSEEEEDASSMNPHHHSYPPSFPVHQRPFSTKKSTANLTTTNNSTIQQMTDFNHGDVDEGAATASDNGTTNNICFSISKQRIGLPIDQAKYCDFFLHVPRMSLFVPPGDDDDSDDDGVVVDGVDEEEEEEKLDYGLLDTQTSLSIALHHYTAWAKYHERSISGYKFDLDRTRTKDLCHKGKDCDGEGVRLVRQY